MMTQIKSICLLVVALSSVSFGAGANLESFRDWKRADGPITCLSISDDGKRVAVGDGVESSVGSRGRLRVFDADSLAMLSEMTTEQPVSSCHFSDDGKAITFVTRSAFAVWDIEKQVEVLKEKHGDAFFTHLRVSPATGLAVVVRADLDHLAVSDISSGKIARTLEHPYVTNCAFDRSCRTLISIGAESIKKWDAKTWALLQSKTIEGGKPLSEVASFKDRIFTWGPGAEGAFRDVDRLEVTAKLVEDPIFISACLFASADVLLIATGENVDQIAAESGKRIATEKALNRAVSHLAATPDRAWIAVAGTDKIHSYRVRLMKLRMR